MAAHVPLNSRLFFASNILQPYASRLSALEHTKNERLILEYQQKMREFFAVTGAVADAK